MVLDKSMSAFSVHNFDLLSSVNGEYPQNREESKEMGRYNADIEHKFDRQPFADVFEDKMVFKIVRIDRKTKKEYVLTKSRRFITRCSHIKSKYYAKGMCKNCYHHSGRLKKATLCIHTDRVHYAKGLCKRCYLTTYHQ